MQIIFLIFELINVKGRMFQMHLNKSLLGHCTFFLYEAFKSIVYHVHLKQIQ